MRLTRGKDFLAARNGGVRVSAGPLQVSMRPNDLRVARLGLSISRRVGNAVVRNTLKRRLREAFRLMQHDWREFAPAADDAAKPQGYDVIVAAKAHEALTLIEYRAALSKAVREAHQSWLKKQRRTRKPPSREA